MIRFASIVITGVAALILLNGFAVSQDTKTQPADPPKVKAPPLPPGWKNLNLTAEQKAKVHTIQADYKAKIKALEDQIKALHQQQHVDMVAVLTADQKAELRKALVPDDKKPDDTKKPDSK